MMMKLINLTGHNINIVTGDGTITIPSDGIIRLVLETVPVSFDSFDFPVVERKVKGIEGDTHLLDGADAVIVSAQVAPYIKEQLDKVLVFTVGETIRERNPDGTVVIKGAKGLVLN